MLLVTTLKSGCSCLRGIPSPRQRRLVPQSGAVLGMSQAQGVFPMEGGAGEGFPAAAATVEPLSLSQLGCAMVSWCQGQSCLPPSATGPAAGTGWPPGPCPSPQPPEAGGSTETKGAVRTPCSDPVPGAAAPVGWSQQWEEEARGGSLSQAGAITFAVLLWCSSGGKAARSVVSLTGPEPLPCCCRLEQRVPSQPKDGAIHPFIPSQPLPSPCSPSGPSQAAGDAVLSSPMGIWTPLPGLAGALPKDTP